MTHAVTATQRAFLLGLREDGSPTCHPMTGVMIGDEPSFNSYRKSVKVRNFLRDPRAAVVLLENWQVPPSAADIRKGVMIETSPPGQTGTAAEKVADEILAVPDSVRDRVQQRVDAGKRIYFRLKTER